MTLLKIEVKIICINVLFNRLQISIGSHCYMLTEKDVDINYQSKESGKLVTWHQCEESINNSLLIELRGSDSAARFGDSWIWILRMVLQGMYLKTRKDRKRGLKWINELSLSFLINPSLAPKSYGKLLVYFVKNLND